MSAANDLVCMSKAEHLPFSDQSCMPVCPICISSAICLIRIPFPTQSSLKPVTGKAGDSLYAHPCYI